MFLFLLLFIIANKVEHTSDRRLEDSLIRKVSRVFCECRRHRCDGLHWSPGDDNGGETAKEEEEEEAKEKKKKVGSPEEGHAIYEPPIPADFIAGTMKMVIESFDDSVILVESTADRARETSVMTVYS